MEKPFTPFTARATWPPSTSRANCSGSGTSATITAAFPSCGSTVPARFFLRENSISRCCNAPPPRPITPTWRATPATAKATWSPSIRRPAKPSGNSPAPMKPGSKARRVTPPRSRMSGRMEKPSFFWWAAIVLPATIPPRAPSYGADTASTARGANGCGSLPVRSAPRAWPLHAGPRKSQ